MKTVILLFLTLHAVLLSAATATLITNGDFSSGLTGYTTTGSVQTGTIFSYASSPSGIGGETFVPGAITPTTGTNVTQIRTTPGGANLNTVASSLGVSANALRTFSNGLTHPGLRDYNLQGGSSLVTTFTGSGALTFDWHFWRDDYPNYNDIAFFTIAGAGISGTEIILLSDVVGSQEAQFDTVGRGTGAGTGWRNFNYNLPSTGSYTIGFATLNARDNNVGSFLHIDNIQVTPEVSPAIAVLFFGLLGIFTRRSR